MRLRPDQLDDHLAGTLAPVYVVHGDDPLLTDEACQTVRDSARDRGYSERQIFTVERGFDWNALTAYSQSMSLFAEKRIIELRLPTGKPGDAGSRVLVEYASRPGEDTVLLVWSARLDKKTQSSKWFKALDKAGTAIAVYSPDPGELPMWIQRRMLKQGLKPETGVADMLAYRYEGNLMACAQEVEKLHLLFGEGKVSVADIEHILGDNARFDVFALVDSCLQGNGPAVVRALEGLRSEGIAPALVLWALVREMRSLGRMATEISAGKAEAQVFQSYRIWAKRQPLVRQALKRHRRGRWYTLLQGAHRADKVIKGRKEGDTWQALKAVGLAFCGVQFGPAH